MSASTKFRAFAKINLDLRVLSRRPDGYHELRTLFQTISLADTIGVQYDASPRVEIEIDSTVAIEDNLVARAARLVARELACGGLFRFTIDKRIPMGAGLGGGSSDAAAVLRALPPMMDRSIPPARLHALALALGSDVPFFLHGGAAIGLGRGEELYPVPDLPPLAGVIVTPAIHVSTAEAYRALSPTLNTASLEEKQAGFRQLVWSLEAGPAKGSGPNWSLTANDFEAPVFAAHPELARIRASLACAGALCARMSGSGSSVFGLFPDRASAARAAEAVSAHPFFPFDFVDRHAFSATCSNAETKS